MRPARKGTPLDAVLFISTGIAFEVDNLTIAGAIPGPAIWAMMFLGFAFTASAFH